jgi:N,N-dimethylformamidase
MRTDLWSPLPGPRLYGYTDEVSCRPGSTLSVMAGLGNVEPPAAATARIDVVRLRHGDANPAGPGYLASDLDWGQPAAVELEPRASGRGSYLVVDDHPDLRPSGPFTLALWYLPTLRDGRWEALAAKWTAGNLAYAIFLTGQGCLTTAISCDGRTAGWATGRQEVVEGRWQFVALAFDPASGRAEVHQALDPAGPIETARRELPARPLHQGDGPLLFAASPHPASPDAGRWAHLNGKLSDPVLLAGALDAGAAARLASGDDPAGLAPVLAHWSFADEVCSVRVPDRCGRHDARALNAPSRAVTGPRFDGLSTRLYTDRRDQYAAIHFHDDDLDDPEWPVTLSVEIPTDAESGLHAVRLRLDDDVLHLPFVVPPATRAADVAVLIPTLSWQAYRSNREAFSTSEDGVRDPGLCLYDLHRDRSIVYHVSRRAPSRSGQPTFVGDWGAHAVASDLYLLDWLEHEGIAHDAYCDEDLHHGGAGILDGYRCLILGAHPEYWTGAMLDALEDYLDAGGRVMYLGGNGLFWVTSIHPERPWLLEVRKCRPGDNNHPISAPGEYQHATTLELGGLWSARGRPPRRLVGVETSTSVFVHARGRWGYERTPATADPRYAFVFDGVEEDPIGAYGLNLGSAAAVEMDCIGEWPWRDAEPPVLLARACHPEFLAMTRPELLAPQAADLTLRVGPRGSAVFSAGSIAWTGSLSHRRYENGVARITRNVLRRFLERPPGMSVIEEADTAGREL